MGSIRLQQVASKHLPSSRVPRVSPHSAWKSEAGPSWTAGLSMRFDMSRALSKGFELTLHGNTIAFRGELMQRVLGYLAVALGQGITLLQCYLTGDLQVSHLSG